MAVMIDTNVAIHLRDGDPIIAAQTIVANLKLITCNDADFQPSRARTWRFGRLPLALRSAAIIRSPYCFSFAGKDVSCRKL